MANFYVGQRVRIIRKGAAPASVGTETKIRANYDSLPLGPCWELDIPCAHLPGQFWIVQKNRAGEYLAPIIPPHEAGQWSVIEALMPSLRDMRELA